MTLVKKWDLGTEQKYSTGAVIPAFILRFKKTAGKICETEKLHIYLQPIGFLN